MTDSTPEPATITLTPSERPSAATLFLAVLLATVALYLPSLKADFLVLDDPQYVTGNPYILYPSWGKFAAFFTEVLKPSVVAGYYQPLTMASLMLDRVIEAHLAGVFSPRINPTIFHLTNILLHGLCAGLVFVLILRITRARWIAFACALLFAAHPLNVEVVAWVSQRKALLSTLFALLMLLAYLQYGVTRRPVWLFLTTLSFALSVLSKPTGLFLPLVLLLFDVWPLHRPSIQALREKWPLFAVALVGGWIAYVSQTSAVNLTDAGQHRGVLLTVLIACHNLAFYLVKIVLPIRLCPHYILPPEFQITPLAWPFAAGLLFTVAFIAICVRTLLRRDHTVWTLLVAFLLLLGPTLGPVRFMGTIAADRFAYLPMIVLLVLVGEWVRRQGPRAKRILVGIGLSGAAVFAIATWRQQNVWQDSVALYQAILVRFPDSAIAQYGLGNACLDRYNQSLTPRAKVTAAERKEFLDEAFEAHQKTIALDPAYSNAYYRVGHILILSGRSAEGIEMIKSGLNQPHADPEGYFFLGLAYTHVGDDAHAIPAYEESLKHRSSIEAHHNLANALLRTGHAAEAIPHYECLYELNPADLDGQQNWVVALITVGDLQAAIGRLEGIIQIRESLVAQLSGSLQEKQASNLADARYTLAGALALNGDANGAIDNLRRAMEVKPELLLEAERNRAFAGLMNTAEWRKFRESVSPR